MWSGALAEVPTLSSLLPIPGLQRTTALWTLCHSSQASPNCDLVER